MKKKVKSFHCKLTEEDQLKLISLAETFDINKSKVIRRLIRVTYKAKNNMIKKMLTKDLKK